MFGLRETFRSAHDATSSVRYVLTAIASADRRPQDGPERYGPAARSIARVAGPKLVALAFVVRALKAVQQYGSPVRGVRQLAGDLRRFVRAVLPDPSETRR